MYIYMILVAYVYLRMKVRCCVNSSASWNVHPSALLSWSRANVNPIRLKLWRGALSANATAPAPSFLFRGHSGGSTRGWKEGAKVEGLMESF